MKHITTIFFTSLLSVILTITVYKLWIENDFLGIEKTEIVSGSTKNTSKSNYEVPNLTVAANKTINHVVHVKNVSYKSSSRNSIFDFIYGYEGNRQVQPQIGTGSGVIISEDGYIVTNNHVIQDASQLEITLNDNRSFPANLIGTDPKTDIALLKIDVPEKLSYATFADSDAIEVGEWVLAVGNPYNLTSTVTAGIISAKARNLSEDGIQSFIQTDAAVNPGNSGGALVNTQGELIGINTLISSTTGSYVGYSFAVPSNMAKKIVEDLLEFGNVQQGILGVQGYELNRQIANAKNIDITQGFYIEAINLNSGAAKANLQKGDVILKIDNKPIKNFLELNAAIATKRPNDKVTVTFVRNNNQQDVLVQLSKKEIQNISFNGFELENLNDNEKNALGINYGVKIKNISNPNYKPYATELKNAIILSINGKKIANTEMANEVISRINNKSNIRLDLITRNGERLRIVL